MNIGEKIKQRRNQLGLTLADVANALGVNKSTVLRYETNEIEKFPLDTIEPLANVLKVSKEYLMGWEENENIPLPSAEPVIQINTYEFICCGNGSFVDDNVIGVVSVPISILPKGKKDFFAQYAKGDSMIGSGINDGDLLIFSKEQCSHGQIGCFCIDENIATCKKLQMTCNNIILIATNDRYEPIIIAPENYKCIGKLVAKLSKVDL